ncbi:AI-2E family transporter [Peribacillus asahii]|uniref:AI-2E family transporter n=1 Tax=Peribacillus asahii TaxID=228899 RepID=UPI002079F285|nr:AI-2E family transporter [Peribacillus asahii]USK60492.1 AI-2E family transporter [Peribacillus asahii]
MKLGDRLVVKEYLQSKGFSRLIALVVVVIFLISIGSMLNLLLFTFIFTFLMGRLERFITTQVNKVIRINSKVVIAFLYSIVLSSLGIVLYKYLPVITMQLTELVKQIVFFFQNPPDSRIIRYIISYMNDVETPLDFQTQVNFVYLYIADLGKLTLQIFLSILLSLFFLLEKDKIIRFTSKFKRGKFSSFFLNIEHFGRKFVNSFGKVIEVQFLIATTNAVLSITFLWIMGFPQLIGLGIMIFFLGLIPVAGVIISLIPLSMIAYSIGGISMVIAVLIMIAVIHAIESYILNPKFMSAKTNLPTFFTFIVLIFSEHFLGIWGLIIGIPIFIFLLDMLDIHEDNHKATR